MWKKIFVVKKISVGYTKNVCVYRLTVFTGVVLFGIKIGYWINHSKVETGTFHNMYGEKEFRLVEFRFDTIENCVNYIRDYYSYLIKLNIDIKL